MSIYRKRVVVAPREVTLRPANPAPGRSQQAEAKISFANVWDAVREGKWLILASTVLVTALITAYTMTLEPTYETASVVLVDTRVNRAPGAGSGMMERRALTTEVGVLQQSVKLSIAVGKGLQELAARSGDPSKFPILVGEEGQPLDSISLAATLMKRARFLPNQEQGMIIIGAESSTREEAVAIANLYAVKYEEYSRNVSRESIVARKAFLQEQVDRIWDELNRVEDQWVAYARGQEVYTYGSDGERLIEEVSRLKSRRTDAQFELEAAQNTARMLTQRLDQIEPGLAGRISSSQATAGLETNITELNTRIAGLQADAGVYYAANPALKGNEASVPELSDKLKQIRHFEAQRDQLQERLVRQLTQSPEIGAGTAQVQDVVDLKNRLVEANMASSEQQKMIDALDMRIGTYDSRLSSLPRQTVHLEQLQREKDQIQRLYNTFSAELGEARIAEEAEIGYVKVMRAAFTPMVPVRPNYQQNVILGVMLGLGFGLGIAFLKVTMSGRLRRPEDLHTQGYSLVGIIPPMQDAIKALHGGKPTVEVGGRAVSTSLFPLLSPWSPIAENYRLLRTNLEYQQISGTAKVLLLTSPEQSDGKTVNAVNLAIAMAQSGRRTLMIDADLRRPSAHGLLGASRGPGLAEALSGGDDSIPQLQETSIENLYFLGAGKVSLPPAELIGSNRMRTLLEEFRHSFDAIVIDSPPVLAVTDPLLLATQADATVVVVSAEKSDMKGLEVTKNALEAVGVTIAGTILNRFDASKNGGSYGYGSSYGRYEYTAEAVA